MSISLRVGIRAHHQAAPGVRAQIVLAAWQVLPRPQLPFTTPPATTVTAAARQMVRPSILPPNTEPLEIALRVHVAPADRLRMIAIHTEVATVQIALAREWEIARLALVALTARHVRALIRRVIARALP